jgi:hypothetical protein
MTALIAVPMDLAEANEFVANFHRHNKPVVGARFAVGASDGEQLWGVAICGRPVARRLQDKATAEVTRCCVRDGAPRGTCSFLYAALWRAWRALGGQRLITYTLQSESGASLRGAGWRVAAELPANDKQQWRNRPGREWQPVVGQAKLRWEACA